MISKTKYKIENKEIEKIFRAAGIGGITGIAPLGAGEYNAVFSVSTREKEYVLKIAPAREAPVMTYEKDMMRTEVFWYRQMREHTPITVPDVYFEDFERKQIPTDYFIMEKLSGKQLDQMKFSGSEQAQSNSITATMAAQIHKIKNDQFGYIQNGLYDNWYQAIRAMTQSLLDDCARAKKNQNAAKSCLPVSTDIRMF